MDKKLKLITGIIVLILFLFLGKYVSAEEVMEKGIIECTEPDGEAGYYVTKPMVYVYHQKEQGITKVLFQKPDGESVEEILENGEKESLCIDETWFTEGKHLLEVWNENTRGEVIEESKIVKEFLIDTKQPKPIKFMYQKEEEKELLCFSDKSFVELSVEDEIAGIKELYYRLENGEEIKNETDHLIIELPINYAGHITAWAVDKAGNKSEEIVSKYIIVENKAPEIQISSKDNLGIWHNKEVVLDIGVKENETITGIAKVKCYVNGKLVEEKENTSPFTSKEQFFITIREAAEIVVKAEDYAGNTSIMKQKVLVDREKPKIQVEGIYDHMITGEEVLFSCVIDDNLLMKSAKAKFVWQNENNEEVVLDSDEWQKGEKTWRINKKLAEDGIYHIEIQALDYAGNVIEQKYQIVIDKTNPLIRYVEELDGKYLPIFKWKYNLNDIIWDFTNYTYEIRLDGKLKNMQITEKNEGKHVFTIQATDAVGNMSEARAEFIIDHTKPVILFEGIENGEIYEEQIKLTLSTENEKDRITEIWVNGKRQEMNFQILFDKIGKYELVVKAEDLAGNKTTEKVDFEIKKKERNVLSKIFYPENIIEDKKVVKNEENMWGLYVILGLAIAGGISIGCLYKKKKSHKREDAG